MTNKVARFEVAANDLGGVRRFYSDLFAWETSSDDPTRFSLFLPAEGIPGLVFQAPAGLPTFVTVYIEVDDLEAHCTRAERLGGTIYVPATPSPVPGERFFAVIGDPEGNLVGLVQRA